MGRPAKQVMSMAARFRIAHALVAADRANQYAKSMVSRYWIFGQEHFRDLDVGVIHLASDATIAGAKKGHTFASLYSRAAQPSLWRPPQVPRAGCVLPFKGLAVWGGGRGHLRKRAAHIDAHTPHAAPPLAKQP